MVQFIPVSGCDLGGNEEKYLHECIRTNWISSLGKFIQEFESQYSKYINMPYSATCNGGTAALHLALLSLGIGKGDEVIVPSFTFIATINPVLYCGATPVFADIDEITWCLDPKSVEQKITTRTKAIIVVHLYGSPAPMNELKSLTENKDIAIIEDCAEAMGATYEGKAVGSLSDISCQSFYGNKMITCGEGGMVSTRSEKIIESVKAYRDHGMDPNKRYFHFVMGYNYRMTNIQAAVGLAQFERIDEFLKQRQRIFDGYYSHLKNISGLIMPFSGDNTKQPVNWLFTMLVKDGKRDSLAEFLNSHRIDTRPVFIPCHTMPYINLKLELPVTQIISDSGLSLPTYTLLKNNDINRICSLIGDFFKFH